MIDMARWLVGDIASVSALLDVFVKRAGLNGEPLDPANDSALLLAEFANGAQGVIQASALAHTADRGMYQQVRLYGEAGSLGLDFPWEPVPKPVLRGARSQEGQMQTLEVPDSYFAGSDPANPWSVFLTQPAGVRQFIDAILADQPVSPNFLDGFKNQQIIDAAIESNQKRTAIPIALVP
jgi:predicted dehydrogenase